MAETWKVSGTVDIGAVDFPERVRRTTTFMASGWEQALKVAGRKLYAESNQLGSPVDVIVVERIRPVP
jgi:hypothetical protein